MSYSISTLSFSDDCPLVKRECDILIHAGLILTQNAKREVLENSSLAILDGRIAAIGPKNFMQGAWISRKVYDLPNMAVLPGLINAHTHAAMTFLRGLADDRPLMEWLEKSVFPVEARLTREIVELGSLLGYAEMLASGTTACIDMYIFEDAVFDAAGKAGLRCLGGEAIFMFPSAACTNYRDALQTTSILAEKYENHSRISVAVNPHSVYTTTPEILSACRDLALRKHLPMHIHLAETEAETRQCLTKTGLRPVAWCAENGLFDTRMICAHLVDVNREEAEFLAKKGAIGVHNPSSNMKLASGAAPVDMMARSGLALGLGTDGPASNNTLNMFQEMGKAALLQKLATGDPSALPAQAVLDMATLGGAAAFGDAELGVLAPGAKADCVALKLDAPNLQPLHNPVSQIVYAASGHECALTMVEGEVLYEQGKFTRFDYAGIQAEIKSLRDFAKGRV